MSPVVSKSPSVIVRPSEPVTTRGTSTTKLSSFDKGLHTVPSTSLLLFENPIQDAAETIKGALSRALVHYYPIAGRIVSAGVDDDGDEEVEVHIQCDDDGVLFVAASTSHTLKEAIGLDGDAAPSSSARELLDELAVYYPGMACGAGDPLLLMQVTEFACGGFALGVTWNHAVADGVGMAQFLRAIGELARGSPSPSVVPVRWDASLPTSPPPSFLPALERMHSLQDASDHGDDLAVLDITVPARSVARIRAGFGSRFGGQSCTVFEAALAVLWRCRTLAAMAAADPAAPTLLLFLANVRKHVSAKEGYYGNCTIEQPVMATSGAVATGDIVDVVKMIKDAKDQIPNKIDGIMSGPLQTMASSYNGLPLYHTVAVTSWRNLGFNDANFGGGTPARVTSSGRDMPPWPAASGFLCNGRGGVDVLSALVKEEHADTFRAELARFM